MTPGKLFIVWMMASASATTPLIGFLLYPYGLTYMIAAVVIAWIIGAIPAGLFSEMGREVPLSALVVSRKTFGWDGSLLFSALFTIVNLGWFALNTDVGASILPSITHTSSYLWDVMIGGIQIVLVLFGMKWLEIFYRYTIGILIVCYLALTIYLITHFALHYPRQTGPMNWGLALTTVLTFSLLAWTYKLSTTSRFAVSSAKTGGRKASYFLLPSIGIIASVLIMGVLGAYSQQATGNWNIALLRAHITGWGAIAAIGASLAVIHTNAMNLYPSTVDLLVVLNIVHRKMRWEQPIATIILGVGGTALAMAGIVSHVSTLLNDAGDVIIAFTFVMLVDWLYVQKRATKAAAFFQPPTDLKTAPTRGSPRNPLRDYSRACVARRPSPRLPRCAGVRRLTALPPGGRRRRSGAVGGGLGCEYHRRREGDRAGPVHPGPDRTGTLGDEHQGEART
jgi:purine-cytosine permease-like protein